LEKKEIIKIFEAFEKLKVLIIGDVMLDSYLWGSVSRISPEAPVPVVLVNKRESRLGGAANVALNIKSLGAQPVIASVVGTDPKGSEFAQLLKNQNIGSELLLPSKERITTTKFRIFGNKMQLLRVDEEIETSRI